MKLSARLRLKTYLLILLMGVFGPLGNVLLGKGMKKLGAVTLYAPDQVFKVLGLILTTGTIWLGIACLIAFFVAYLSVLSFADYSYVQPVSSMAYGMVALLGHFVLNEVVTPMHWLGVVVICVGVFIVGHTPMRTTEPES